MKIISATCEMRQVWSQKYQLYRFGQPLACWGVCTLAFGRNTLSLWKVLCGYSIWPTAPVVAPHWTIEVDKEFADAIVRSRTNENL